ncbi:adult-specific rigid cuticular protein 11.9-like [Centruroides sculpturatus]|uniref:adult-specific rigid cuticular protein 11.9-like n=1 Tax=Centruroides sculpturatus TaxID=218467 RepID=UPI000C6CF18B|nr:adult-specific rigid cuticular protein 11.9-like [Centruroides sculpturatus]
MSGINKWTFDQVFTAVFHLQTATDIMKFIILSALVVCAFATDAHLSSDGINYNFGYKTGDAGLHTRSESGTAGAVSGQYSYVDPNGHLRQVTYTADASGFHPSGDIGPDKKTLADAAAIAALAPKAPEPLKHHYLGYPFHHPYGAYYHHPNAYFHGVPNAYSYGYHF